MWNYLTDGLDIAAGRAIWEDSVIVRRQHFPDGIGFLGWELRRLKHYSLALLPVLFDSKLDVSSQLLLLPPCFSTCLLHHDVL